MIAIEFLMCGVFGILFADSCANIRQVHKHMGLSFSGAMVAGFFVCWAVVFAMLSSWFGAAMVFDMVEMFSDV